MLEEFGAGRFGSIYRARDAASGALVAVKVFDQDLTVEQGGALAAALERLCQAPLDHGSLVAPLAAGLDDQAARSGRGRRPWLAEPWIDARPLDQMMRRDGVQPLGDVILRLTQIAGALDFAAAVGLHHGMLHPRDILVSEDITKLTGVGVLQALGEAGLEVPMDGAYVSPQRASGSPPTIQDDIYALAAITFELLYGAPPPERSGLRSSMAQLTGVDRDRLVDLLAGSLSPDPDERPATALHFAAALQQAVIPIPIRNSDYGIPIGDSDPASILIRDSRSDSHSAPELLLRAGEMDAKPEATSEFESHAKRHPEFELVGGSRESQSNRWLPVAAALVIGILTGLAVGFVAGQRDITPAPLSAERAPARDQRAAEVKTAGSSGQTFTDSVIPPQQVADQPVIPPPESTQSVPARRSERPERNGRYERGVLQVDSRPRGARVFMDGRLVGKTPLSLPEVQPGTHAVRIDLIGYQRWVTSVNVAPGSRQRVAASLLMNGER